jgi:hypothetical protein
MLEGRNVRREGPRPLVVALVDLLTLVDHVEGRRCPLDADRAKFDNMREGEVQVAERGSEKVRAKIA